MTPALSVLLPVRNAARFLREALLSLQAQTFTEFEVVLVDDGSDDETLAVAEASWAGDPRLSVLRSNRLGLVGALNRGLEACRAPLVARMDADDRAHPRRFELQLELLAREPTVSIVGSLVSCFAEAGIAAGYAAYEEWLNGLVDHETMVREIFVESPLAHPSVVFRRAAILELGGYQDRGWPEDYDLWLRAAARGLRFAKVPEILLYWRDHPARHSRDDERYGTDAILRCKAFHLAVGPCRARRELLVWGAGKVGRRLRKYLEAEGLRVAAFVDIDFGKIGRRVRGAPVLAPEKVANFPDHLVVTAVGSRGARELIRSRLVAMGRREGTDFFCAA